MILAWHAQRDTIPLVKTSNFGRLAENIGYTEVTLTEEEVAKIDNMERGARLYNPKFLDM